MDGRVLVLGAEDDLAGIGEFPRTLILLTNIAAKAIKRFRRRVAEVCRSVRIDVAGLGPGVLNGEPVRQRAVWRAPGQSRLPDTLLCLPVFAIVTERKGGGVITVEIVAG